MYRVFGLLLVPALAFAGAGSSGGGGPTQTLQLYFDLTYGTFTAGGSMYNYLATNAPLLEDTDGVTLLESIADTGGLDSRIYSGISELLASPTSPVTLTVPISGCIPSSGTTSCTPQSGSLSYPATQTMYDIAFSTGALGQIGDVTDASQIAAEAELLDLVASATPSTSIAQGSFSFMTLGNEDFLYNGGPDFIVDATELTSTINLTELDFTGTPIPSAVPEPSALWFEIAGITAGALIVVFRRKSRA